MATKYEWYESDDSASILPTGFYMGQSFTIGTVGTNENFNTYSVKLKLYRINNPGTITIEIYSVDVSGFPTGSALSSGTTDGDTLTTNTAGEIREIIMSSYELQASTKYAIVIFCAAESIGVKLDSAAGYTGGNQLLWEEEWFDGSDDLYFSVWGTSTAIGTNQFINVGDTFHEITEMNINIGDVWKPVKEMYVNVGDTWKPCFIS